MKGQIFIKITMFTDFTTTDNFQMKGIKMTLQSLFWQSGWIKYKTALNAVQAKGSEQSISVCITSEFPFDTQTFLVYKVIHIQKLLTISGNV